LAVYDTNANVTRAADDGTTSHVHQEFRSILSATGYPGDWLSRVSFYVDSHENVERNYEGSYFLPAAIAIPGVGRGNRSRNAKLVPEPLFGVGDKSSEPQYEDCVSRRVPGWERTLK
jgi:hypothetical protein